jgi:hypothetical protein
MAMSKPFKLLAIMLGLVIMCSFFPLRVPIREARATYVEGPIDKNTVWTLVDSPFVVSNDITVYSGVALTIEPAVEVRFGGNFSLIINGTLVAEGTEPKNIKFTSNSLNPEPGDWGTIWLRSPEASAVLSNCVTEYGTNGILLENGNLILKDSRVRFNSENGITTISGNAEIDNNSIENNTASGIDIEEPIGVSAYDNNLTSNYDGIKLTGNLTSQNLIQRNYFSNNTHSGISLGAPVDDDTSIINNILSANRLYGLYVSINASTRIAHNYILNNSVGIFYEAGKAHEAHFNDIIGNGIGMDVSNNASVKADYNYWGDRSGPNHKMLNPRGKGNPVGDNSSHPHGPPDLNFIFFLTAPIDHVNELPHASLWADRLIVAPNQNVTFVGTNSLDEGSIDQYNFTFEDGKSSGWTTLTIFFYNYSSIGTRIASLVVKDDFNETSSNAAQVMIDVENRAALSVALSLSNTTVSRGENVTATAYVSNDLGPVDNANVEFYTTNGESFYPLSGSTDSTGHFTTTFTAPNVTDATDVRIFARASKDGYADGSDFQYVKVLPPLNVQVVAQPQTIMSEEDATLAMTVLDAYGQPVAEAQLTLETDGGSISPSSVMTDQSGNANFTFVAPLALSQFTVTISFRAQEADYADGYGQTTIIIEPKELNLQVSVEPKLIISENTTIITANVAYNSNPISEANVTISSDAGGTFSNATQTTDENGAAQFIYTAPQLTTPQYLTVTLNVTASKAGYVNGQTQATLTVLPKTLIVDVDAEPNATVSEANVSVSVHVTYSYDMSPLSEATVTVTSDSGGTFSNATAQTDDNGIAVFVFKAPPTNAPMNISISALVEKTGYVSEQNQTTIKVEQGVLAIRTETNIQPITPGETAIITAFATCNGNPVANTSITVSSNSGSFDVQNGMTDSNGMCRFVYTAPNTTKPLVATMSTTASKDGYANAEGQLRLDVVPSGPQQTGGGLSIMTLLAILIPIVAVVIVVVLIKMKVILVSFGNEGDEWG